MLREGGDVFWNRRKTTSEGERRDPPQVNWKEVAQSSDGIKALDDSQVQATVYAAICDYGQSNDRSHVSPLMRLYKEYAQRIASRRRAELLEVISTHLSAGRLSANAMLPFVFRETETSLACRAVLEYAAHRYVPASDPLAGVRDLIGMFQSGQLANRVGVFAGLLQLGDRRVTVLLRECRNALDADEVAEVTAIDTGFLYAPVLEFYVEWIEELLRLGNASAAISVAEVLLDAAHGGQLDSRILEEKRRFPERPGDTCTVERLAALEPSDYSKRLLPTLQRLVAVDGAPPLLAQVVRAWSSVGT
jgi:hypothetical protein